MKNLLPFIFCGFSLYGFSQMNTAMPQEATAFYRKAMPNIKPGIKNVVEKSALGLKERAVNTDSLTRSLAKTVLLKHTTQQDIEAIAVLIMVQISINADEELKSLVIQMSKSNSQDNSENVGKKKTIEKKVERILYCKSLLAENVSVIMKRISGAQDVVINNLK
jgi:hypothetical protein